MRPVPFLARWQLEPLVGGAFRARLPLDDPGWFAGHYPGAPILPGSFLIEALLQAVTAALPTDLRLEEIVSCRFHAPLGPGDVVAASFTLKEADGNRILVGATATGRALAAELTMLVGPPAPATGELAIRPPSAAPPGRRLDADFIRRALPHRPPVLLVEEALVLERARPTLLAWKTIAATEPCFVGAGGVAAGAYPSMLIVESFCQSCGLLRAATVPAGEARDEGKAPVVAKLAGLRVLGEAGPGDRLEHQVELVVRTDDGAVFAGYTAVAGRVVLEVKRVVAALAPVPVRDDALGA
jgi:3-hydroxymyristoyl/3-hydroxydecanoyl-(acyl carrier protein) dehydratase